MLEACAQSELGAKHFVLSKHQEKYAHRDPQPGEGRLIPVSVLVHGVH